MGLAAPSSRRRVTRAKALGHAPVRFEHLIEAMPAGLAVHLAEPPGPLLVVNRAWGELTGVRREQAGCFEGWLALANPTRTGSQRLDDGDVQCRLEVRRGDPPAAFPVWFQSHPCGADERGRALRCAMVFDIGRACDENALMTRRKDELIAALGHELRNPLAVARLATDSLAKSSDSRTVTTAVQRLTRQVERMSRLVDDLLDMSRIARGKLALRLEPSCAAHVAREVIEDRMEHANNRSVALIAELPAALPLVADALRLAQVIDNLLANAIKYSEPGGTIVVSGEQEPGAIVLRVRDTGIGIDSVALERVFEPFEQAGRTRGGLGLGLAIVKGIVELHGGRVAIASDGRGKGTEVMVRLPAGRA